MRQITIIGLISIKRSLATYLVGLLVAVARKSFFIFYLDAHYAKDTTCCRVQYKGVSWVDVPGLAARRTPLPRETWKKCMQPLHLPHESPSACLPMARSPSIRLCQRLEGAGSNSVHFVVAFLLPVHGYIVPTQAMTIGLLSEVRVSN